MSEIVMSKRPMSDSVGAALKTASHAANAAVALWRLRPAALSLAIALSALPGSGMAAPGDIPHPSLLVTGEEIAALRARASQAPYDSIRSQAISIANSATLAREATSAGNIRDRAVRMSEIMSATALAYLLETDPAIRARHRDKIVAHMAFWDPGAVGSLSAHYQWATPPTSDWNYMTPTSNAFAQSVLALDIVYNDLTAAQRTRFNAWLAIPGNFYSVRRIDWVTAGLGARITWALYNNDTALAASAIDEYLADTKKMIGSDGVFAEGTGYAIVRWLNPDREHKATTGQLLARRGLIASSEWHDDARLGNFMEWLNGYAFTPARTSWVIGDSEPLKFSSWMGNAYNARRYSAEAGRYEAWLKQGFVPKGRLSAYVFTDRTPASEARMAPSRLFPVSGAYFRQLRAPGTVSDQDLAGTLHNPTYQGAYHAHMHKEVNSLHLAGYGQHLLRGSGYAGWASGYAGFSFDYINRRAVSGNVALIDYEIERSGGTIYSPSKVNDHRDTEILREGNRSFFGGDGKFGGGVSGLVTGVVDIATGNTAGMRGTTPLDALSNGNHQRHFFMVQPSGTSEGYFVSFDRLVANADYVPLAPTLKANLVWHPNGNAVQTLANGVEYEWSMLGDANVRLVLFLASAPSDRRLVDGGLATNAVGKYLFASYPMNANRVAQPITVLYPYVAGNPNTPRPGFARIAGAGYTGGRVIQAGGVVDSFYETLGPNEATPAIGIRVRGSAAMTRTENGALRFYAASTARTLRVGNQGFESPSFITVVIDNGVGKVRVPGAGATISFFHPGIQGIEVDGVRKLATPANGGVTVTLSGGEHRIRLVGAGSIEARGSKPLRVPR
jgi:hypothetical protein